MEKTFQSYNALLNADDAYQAGQITGDELHDAIVTFTDAIRGYALSFDSDGKLVRVRKLPEGS